MHPNRRPQDGRRSPCSPPSWRRCPGAVGRIWLVFGAEGRLECDAILPEGLDVHEFGPDHLLGAQRDDLDLEHLVRYALRRP